MSTLTCESERLVDELISLSSGKTQFIESVGKIILGAIDYVRRGKPLAERQPCCKSFAGTVVEEDFIEKFGLPAKSKSNPIKLDTVIADKNVDVKFTLGKNWMIPPEAVGEWCLLVRTDYPETFSIGLLKMEERNLTRGANRDGKRSVSKEGKSRIRWIAEGAALPMGACQ